MINYSVSFYDPLFKNFVSTEHEEFETIEGALCRLNEGIKNGWAKCGIIDAATQWNDQNEPITWKAIYRKGRIPKSYADTYGKLPIA